MEKETNLCTLIYHLLVMRIRMGYYQPGDHILSKPICELFDLSNTTVHNALRLLEQEHYISLSKNQRALVIWNAATAQPLPNNYFLDWFTLSDLYQSYTLFLKDILWYGLRLFSATDLESFVHYPIKRHRASDSPVLYWIKQIIAQLGNPFLLDLHRDLILFTYPNILKCLQTGPILESSYLQQLEQTFYQAVELCKKNAPNQLYHQIERIDHLFDQLPFDVNDEIPYVSVNPYRWMKPQFAFSISSNLIMKIISGIYPIHTFLPSMDALAKQYSTSNMTIRRTIWMLNSFGVTQTINGVGTKVLPLEVSAKMVQWDNPEIQKNLLRFLYSLQFLLVTCRRISADSFQQRLEPESTHLMEALAAGTEKHVSHLIYHVWLNQIVQQSDRPTIRKLYSYLSNFIVWGLPLRFLDQYIPCTNELQSVIESLRCQNRTNYIDALEQFCYLDFSRCRQLMIDLGIHDAAAVAVPPIHQSTDDSYLHQ